MDVLSYREQKNERNTTQLKKEKNRMEKKLKGKISRKERKVWCMLCIGRHIRLMFTCSHKVAYWLIIFSETKGDEKIGERITRNGSNRE